MSQSIKLLSCPFCNEPGFDLVGLKMHLIRGWCEVAGALSIALPESRPIPSTPVPPSPKLGSSTLAESIKEVEYTPNAASGEVDAVRIEKIATSWSNSALEGLRQNSKELKCDDGYLLWDNGKSILKEYFESAILEFKNLK